MANYSATTAPPVAIVDGKLVQHGLGTRCSGSCERQRERPAESVNDEQRGLSSLAARIPANTQSVYIPWQLAPKAQLFGQALRSQGKRAVLFGSDGLFDPDNFRIPGSFVSFFPINLRSPVIAAYRRGPGRGKSELFGLPSYQAADVVGRAINRACANGTATRAEVRRTSTDEPSPEATCSAPRKFSRAKRAFWGAVTWELRDFGSTDQHTAVRPGLVLEHGIQRGGP